MIDHRWDIRRAILASGIDGQFGQRIECFGRAGAASIAVCGIAVEADDMGR
jgi:hypothetical protein